MFAAPFSIRTVRVPFGAGGTADACTKVAVFSAGLRVTLTLPVPVIVYWVSRLSPPQFRREAKKVKVHSASGSRLPSTISEWPLVLLPKKLSAVALAGNATPGDAVPAVLTPMKLAVVDKSIPVARPLLSTRLARVVDGTMKPSAPDRLFHPATVVVLVLTPKSMRTMDSVAPSRTKFAVTDLSPSMVKDAGFTEPLKSPLQLTKRYPASGTAVSWTVLPCSWQARSGSWLTVP